MDPLSGLFAALAKKLAEEALDMIVGELPGKMQRLIAGDPEKKAALGKALQAGLEAALKTMPLKPGDPLDSHRARLYEGVLERFLSLPKTAEELAKLVDLRNVTEDPEAVVDIACLDTLFRQAYPVDEVPEAYAGLNFPATMRAFVRAYADAVRLQSDKLPWINTAYLEAMLDRLEPRPRPRTLQDMYLDWLAQECDLLPLSAFNPRYAAPTDRPRVTLRQVYVPLDVQMSPRGEEARRRKRVSEPPNLEALVEGGEPRRVPALAALAEHPKAVLVGDPGSGKTTFINHLAFCLAMAEREPDEPWMERLEGWSPGRLLPVRVVLRGFAAQAVPATAAQGNAGMLWSFLEAELKAHGMDEFYKVLRTNLLERGGLWLLDGLDEVPAAAERRARVREAILDLARTARKCRFFITCRTYAYQDPQDWLEDFQVLPLAHFSPEQVDSFIDRWYWAVAPKEQLRPEAATARIAQLKAAVDRKRNPYLADMATRPLLLTLMADLHTSQGTLPEDRADLYERCVDLLLDYWQQRKVAHDPQGKLVVEVGLLDALGIEKGQLKRNLYRIAFEAHERQGKSPQRGPRTANVQEKDLERVLWPALGSEEKFHTALCYIRDRAGLLLWGGGDVYTFPHRSFQEYLAACHLGTLDDPFQETARRVRDDLEWWREVFLLEAGRVREHPGVAVSLVHALCPISVQAVTDPTATDWRAAALAAQALVELRLPQQIQEKRRQGEYATLFEAELRHVKEWLVALLKVGALPARERVESGRALAHLDDPRPGVRVEPQTELPDIVWCQIPAGPFLMGTQEKDIPALVERLGGEARWYEYETPQREVTLPHFYISRYPVTNAQFAAFVQAGGYTDPKWLMKCWTEAGRRWLKENKVTGPSRFGNPFDLLNHPVVGVSWYEALAFCRWLTERFRIADSDQGIRESGNQALITDSLITDSLITVRLPTEAEWEKAARGTDGRIYPWGDAPDPDRANYYDTGIGATSAVGCFPAGRGPCDALDMSGNVWEWCGTKWRDSYREPADESLIGTGPRVVRGGSWGSSLRDVRCAGRDWYGPLAGLGTLGFRMVVSPGSP